MDEVKLLRTVARVMLLCAAFFVGVAVWIIIENFG